MEKPSLIVPCTVIEISLDQSTLEKMACGSLTGMVSQAMKAWGYLLPEHLILIFPQTSLEWRRKNGGPDSTIVPEYTIPHLLDCVLKLRDQGVKIEINFTGRKEKS